MSDNGGNQSILTSSRSFAEENGKVGLLPRKTSLALKRSKFSQDTTFSARQDSVQTNGEKLHEGSDEDYSRPPCDDSVRSDMPHNRLRCTTSRYENFHSKLVTRQVRHLLYEICSDGTSVLRELSTRELCAYINECVDGHIGGNIDAPLVDRGISKAAAVSEEAANGAALDEITSPTASTSSYPSYSRQSGGGELVGWKKNNNSSYTPKTAHVMSLGAYTSSFHLRHRDLRILFTENHSSEPCVAVRRGVVLIHMESIRAIVLWNRIFLIVDDGADSILSQVEEQMAVISTYECSPDFELRAYETIMNVSMSNLLFEVKSIGTYYKPLYEIR